MIVPLGIFGDDLQPDAQTVRQFAQALDFGHEQLGLIRRHTVVTEAIFRVAFHLGDDFVNRHGLLAGRRRFYTLFSPRARTPRRLVATEQLPSPRPPAPAGAIPRTKPRMSQYRSHPPQLDGGLFLTDGGIETSLIFHDGFELPYFAAFDLLRRPEGRAALKAYYERYLAIATADQVGFILESPTWRASADWADRLWLSRDELTDANWAAIDLMTELRAVHETATTPIVVSGCVGPRGDGYDPGQVMSPEAAAEYHADQVLAFAEAGADMATASTMTNVNEA